MKNILLIDNKKTKLDELIEILEGEYTYFFASNETEIVEVLETLDNEISLIISSYEFLLENNYAGLSLLRNHEKAKILPIIMIINKDEKYDHEIFHYGIKDVIEKPFIECLIRNHINNAITIFTKTKDDSYNSLAKNKFIERKNSVAIGLLNKILMHENMEPSDQLLKIEKYTKLLLNEMCLRYPSYKFSQSQIELISKAAIFNDVGKIYIPSSIIKKPMLLSVEEFNLMESHINEGFNVLSIFNGIFNDEFLNCAKEICLNHHERIDGRGYPHKLKGKKIPIIAQIVGIIDVYVVLTSPRTYKPVYTPAKAMEVINNGECGAFSSNILECLNNISEKIMNSTSDFDNMDVEYEYIINALREEFVEERSDDYFAVKDQNIRLLLNYLSACVYEINVCDKTYRNIYPQYLEFASISIGGAINNGLLPKLSKLVESLYVKHFNEWCKKSFELVYYRLANRKSANFPLFNRINQKYNWYEICIYQIDSESIHSDKMLFTIQDIQEQVDIKDKFQNNSLSNKDFFKFVEENVQLRKKAEIDALTGLYNKMTMQSIVDNIMQTKTKESCGLLVIDMDNFKQVNDTLGHIVGDQVLNNFANLMKTHFRESDLIGRIGGDEFMVLVRNISEAPKLTQKATKLIEAFSEMMKSIMAIPITSISIGGAFFPLHGDNFEEIFRKADKALYVAKESGKKQFTIFSEELVYNDSINIAQPRIQGSPKYKMLIADDLEISRESLAATFSDEYNILLANDGDEAINILKREKDQISIVILDIMMPKVDGFEVLSIMKDDPFLVNIPVIVLTSIDEPDNILKALDLGAMDVISKPIAPSVIIRRVKNVVARTEMVDLLKQNHLLQIEQLEKERYEIIVEQTGVIVFDWHNSGNSYYIIDELKQFSFGENIEGDSFRDWIKQEDVYDDDFPKLEAFIRSIDECATKVEMIVRLKKTTNEYVWCNLVVELSYNYEGVNERAIGTIRIIDEQKRFEDLIRVQNEKYQILLQLSNIIVFDYDVLTDTLLINGKTQGKEPFYEKVDNYLMALKNRSCVAIESRGTINELLKNITEKTSNGMIKFRADYFNNGYEDYELYYVSIEDTNNVVYRVIGRVEEKH